MQSCNGLNVPLDSGSKLTSNPEKTGNSTSLDQSDITKYQSIVGKFMYAMIATRPDLAFAVSTLGRFNSAPEKLHLEAVKKTLRYLRWTLDIGLTYSPTYNDKLIGYNASNDNLIGFCDSDWAGDPDTRRSTTGYVVMLSNGAISWKSQRQQTVALSSTKPEYMAITEASKEAIWLRRLYSKICSQTGVS